MRTGTRTALVAGTSIAAPLLAVLLFGAGPDLTRPNAPAGESARSEEGGKDPNQPDRFAAERHFMRRNDQGVVPMDGLVRAKERLEVLRAASSGGAPRGREGGAGEEGGVDDGDSSRRDGGLWTWQWLGPGNIGGRVRAILIHPTVTNRMWIGSASGGIWRTDDGGASWSPVDDFLPSLAVTSLVMDPTNANTMYAGTGEGFYNFDAAPGAGVFKSTDGGINWFQLASTNNDTFRWVNRLAHHPTASGTLWAACRDVGILESTDGGTSWTTVLSTPSPVGDIKVHPTNGNRLLAGCLGFPPNFYGSVWLSTDGGTNWDEMTDGTAGMLPDDGGRCEVAFGTGNYLYVCMDRNGGEVWRSTNTGSLWSLRSSPDLGSQLWYDNALWVDPTNQEFLVVGAVNAYRSTNGGLSFAVITDWGEYHLGNSAHADQHAIVAHPGYDGSSNRTVFFGNDGGIQRVANIGTVGPTSGWTNLANGLGITQFFKGASSPDGSLIVGGTQDNDKLRYTGGGIGTWYQAETGDGGSCAVDFTDPEIVYGVYPVLYVRKSTNGGDSYFDAYTGLADSASGSSVAPLVMDPSNANTLWAGGTSIWRTTNGAASWSRRRVPIDAEAFCTAIAVLPWNSQQVWVGYSNGRVSRTTNGGSSWTDLDDGSTPLPDRYVSDIALSPHFLDEAIVTFSAFEDDNVWITGDNGATWTVRSGTAPNDLPELPILSVSYHPTDPDWIYVGSDLGVLASEDFGVSWNVTPAYPGDADGPANVEVGDIFWHGSQMVVVTHGRGMWRAEPLPVVWVDLDNAGFEDGSQAFPFDTVSEGLGASGHGTDLSIAPGTYTEGAKTFLKRGLVVAPSGGVVVR